MTQVDSSFFIKAACKGVNPDIFHPKGIQGKVPTNYDPLTDPHTVEECQQAVKAKYCAGCTVSEECFAYTMETGQQRGVWGNTTEQERNSQIIGTKLGRYNHEVGQY